MKVLRILLCISVFLLFVSCTNTATDIITDTEEESEATFHTAVQAIVDKTFLNFNKQVTATSDFIPEDYKILADTRREIVGLDVLLKLWKSHISSLIDLRINDFQRWVKGEIDKIDFSDFRELISEGERSISERFIKLYSVQIREQIELLLREVDFDNFEDCIIQYNAFCITHGNEGGQLQQQADFRKLFTDIIEKSFTEKLSDAEEFYRTTPDPYMEPEVARLFNLE